jgi:hypothetical protein
MTLITWSIAFVVRDKESLDINLRQIPAGFTHMIRTNEIMRRILAI